MSHPRADRAVVRYAPHIDPVTRRRRPGVMVVVEPYPADRVRVREQPAARALVADVLATAGLRSDAAATSATVLQALVNAMDWTTGVVTGPTLQALAAVADCSTRTVSRVLAWARAAGVLAVVETGATAGMLGSRRNRAPSYVFLGPPPAAPDVAEPPSTELCVDPPTGSVGRESPRARETARHARRGLTGPAGTPPVEPWGSYDRITPADQHAAAAAVAEFLRLDEDRVPLHRLVGVLRPWIEAGWTVAALRYAIEHHPDPRTWQDRGRGPITAGAVRAPLAVLAARLAPWRDRFTDLPADLRRVADREERLARLRLLELDAATPPRRRGRVVLSTTEGRAAALALFAARPRRTA